VAASGVQDLGAASTEPQSHSDRLHHGVQLGPQPESEPQSPLADALEVQWRNQDGVRVRSDWGLA
jgi:hypothetical protein